MNTSETEVFRQEKLLRGYSTRLTAGRQNGRGAQISFTWLLEKRLQPVQGDHLDAANDFYTERIFPTLEVFIKALCGRYTGFLIRTLVQTTTPQGCGLLAAHDETSVTALIWQRSSKQAQQSGLFKPVLLRTGTSLQMDVRGPSISKTRPEAKTNRCAP